MRRPLTATAILALGLAACGDSSGGDDETAFTTADGTGTAGETADTTGDGDTTTTTTTGDGDTTESGTDATTGDGDTESGTDADTTGDGDTTTTTTGDGDTTTTGTETMGMMDTGPVPCDVAEADLKPVTPDVMLVLDKSGSMLDNTWDHDADVNTPEVSRWNSLHSVVDLVTSGFDDKLNFGAQLYPSTDATNEYNVNACLVNSPPEVLVAPNNAIPILLGIPIAGSQNIRGGTPAEAGITSALDHLISIDDGDPQAIILVTDGAANCRVDAVDNFDRFETYDPNLLATVTDAWNNLQVPTYVIGIDIANAVTPITGVNDYPPDGEPDGISPYDQLNELAVAGGKPKGGMEDFYQTSNQIELEAALQAIVDDAISCTILLDPVPLFPELLEIVMDDETIPQVMDCENEDGWVFTDPNDPTPDSVELCGSWCGAVPDAQLVKAEYYCEPG